jgi:hypothetical protein
MDAAAFSDFADPTLDDDFDADDDDFDSGSADEWVPAKADCKCCGGYIRKCSGDICSHLGVCECSAADE